MTVRHRLITASPDAVCAVLADGTKYPRWVVGPSDAAVRELAQGRDHLFEAEMKEIRRTTGHPDHTATPAVPDI
ncbi:hypothetical protein [Streptomyces cadmiisoli]|uniref:hypothetical protein n=1 Tax=Streptomyces cadmiisoli TaxID=2184053 RepID=UPI003649915F